MSVDVESLLLRLGYAGRIDVSLKVLQDLKTAFLLSVPFENIDVHIPREIKLFDGAAEEKIVQQRRGGFCYECNFLFHQLISQIGFDAAICSAQMMKNDILLPPFEHMVLLVTIEKSVFLVDVGNGESVRIPMNLQRDEIHMTPEGKKYRIGEFEGQFALECCDGNASNWSVKFVVDPTPRRLEDFSDRCHFQQTSPNSVFTTQPMATLALTDGRRTIRGKQFSETKENRQTQEITFEDEQEYYACLRDKFGLVFAAHDQKFWHP
ncbi:arylamine N-acetyltransferase [Sneathiella marina]|uniref:Arylamine N-acetyltransferase n=1 Tax=Sneathiella marina TaxID=2950108 RepID=A0ABY4W2Z2_9PROT|nr:arylamine N-acetyltransferase [Sneathiella marina]USG60488.1 arylamine N-acetyltransferase [Sneathiella marina]